jgi:DNA-binding NtrC family response regulator
MPRPMQTIRILVIDDEVDLASVIVDSLSSQYDVASANSADEALSLLQKDANFQIILCDLMMPAKTGMDLYEDLKQFNLERKLILMTGGAFTPKAKDFLEKSKLPVLNKPFQLQELRNLIEKLTKLNQ